VAALPKPLKAVGGRFPAIEQKMHEWMDQQISCGLDVRDNVARDKAKAFAREIGFPMERFKASAKWLDKVCYAYLSHSPSHSSSSRTVERLLASLPSLQCARPMAIIRFRTRLTL